MQYSSVTSGFIMSDTNPDTPLPINPDVQPKPADVKAPPALLSSIKSERRSHPWQRLRLFLACNPFYLVSAALLLYSFYLISADRSFLPTEVGQLSFNLGSVQLYEILVVATAIFLARRAIWYDSTLLVGLENLLLLVPFILISQAALIDEHLVWVLCIGAGVLATTRLGLLKRYVSQLDFQRRLAWIGASIIAVNAALPIVYRVLHESKFGTKPDWGAAYETNQYIWWLLVPILCGLMSLVPWPRLSKAQLSSHLLWFPLGVLSLWLVGTGVHLYCLGYVYDFALRPELLAPTAWILLWVLCSKIDQLEPGLKERWKSCFWILPMLATLLATPQPEKIVFLALTGLNISIFVSIFWRRRVALALHLALISIAAGIAGLPEEWGRAFPAQFNRDTCIAGAAVIYFLICTTLSRNPKLGTLGGLVAAISLGMWSREPSSVHWAVQIGFAFLLIHSLRWVDSEEPGAALLRWLAALAWLAHSIAWTHFYSGGWRAWLIAIPVLAAWFVFKWLRGTWSLFVVPAAALLVVLSAPGDVAAVHLESTPGGLLAVIGSFLLFGLGTLGAITKHRWSSPHS
jgi:hypothetical protein